MTQDRKNFGAALAEALAAPFAALPLSFHLGFANFLAWLLRDVFRYRRDVVVTNLSRSFPEMKYAELRQTTKLFYRHLADIFAEAFWFGGRHGERGRRKLNESRIVDVVNPQTFNEVYDDSTNMMVLSSHAGNWELLGGWFCYNHNAEVPFRSGYPEIGVVYLKLKSRVWDRVMADNRCAMLGDTGFDGYVEARSIFRFALSHKEEKFIYIFPTDQFPYKIASRHEIGSFLGQPTQVMTGGASLACKLGMSVSYLRWKSIGRGRYEVEFVPICRDASKETPEGIMEKYCSLLEKDIKEQPWNYLWTHKRWK